MNRAIKLMAVVAFAAYVAFAFGHTPNDKCCRYFKGCTVHCYTIKEKDIFFYY